ncbi:MAG: Eco57I restriction-modification methylase domain-containing protein, partial [Flavobacteriaceae bacterium]|nr:Eco57I restriction-modification methylase domain-containing protein [Flavobacteriaceae bacterium]
HLSKFEKDYALVAFYSKEDDGADWRFSFIKLEYKSELDEEKGKVKTKKEFTPAKRYSFLVGKYEKAHTAKNQLLPLLQNIANNPTIEELEAAFSIEKVTDEFFSQYKDLYIKLYEHFENDSQVKAAIDKAEIDNTRFTKKLLGQIVFLYFLQKKGWLGVAKNERWGTGKKRFVQELNEKAQSEAVNFFKDKLQYLFYEALAKERDNVNSYYERFKCRIPFLNGGLFEADYDWRNANITIPENLFRNEEKNKSGDIGTGVLDVFDRYNFTIKEDEPLDKEVAVDPEMLGKVFENMLDITERKSKGAFYTPREIVHYMCQESLIHYLDNALNSGTSSFQELGSDQAKLFGGSTDKKGNLKIELEHTDNIRVPKKDIETYIREGHFALENDERVATKGETKTYKYQLRESIRQNADLIDQKLSDIRICDPAIGSGAFPVGLLHELVNAMLVLKPHFSDDYLGNKLKGFSIPFKESYSESRYIYRLKRHIIQESIYGVDIDASAIDIARLRLWLSLVVDEDDLDPIETLPNLDYKIVCGNSLIGLPAQGADRYPQLKDELEILKKDFFKETNEIKKRKLRDLINDKIADVLNTASNFEGYKIDFDFKLFFSEVWREKGGFDVVIGNPPYGADFTNEEKQILKNLYPKIKGQPESYEYFIFQAIEQLCSKIGSLTFINPTNFIESKRAEDLRVHMLN